jgi:hypothetical protein
MATLLQKLAASHLICIFMRSGRNESMNNLPTLRLVASSESDICTISANLQNCTLKDCYVHNDDAWTPTVLAWQMFPIFYGFLDTIPIQYGYRFFGSMYLDSSLRSATLPARFLERNEKYLSKSRAYTFLGTNQRPESGRASTVKRPDCWARTCSVSPTRPSLNGSVFFLYFSSYF